MKKQILLLALIFVIKLSYAQNNSMNPDNNHLKFVIDLSTLPSEKVGHFAQKIESLEAVKQVTVANTNILELTYQNYDFLLPNAIKKMLDVKIADYAQEFGLSVHFSSNNELITAFKQESISHKTVLLSGVNTLVDQTNLENTLLARTEVLGVNFNFTTHELFIVYDKGIDDNLFNDIISSTGKQIINSTQDISKYY